MKNTGRREVMRRDTRVCWWRRRYASARATPALAFKRTAVFICVRVGRLRLLTGERIGRAVCIYCNGPNKFDGSSTHGKEVMCMYCTYVFMYVLYVLYVCFSMLTLVVLSVHVFEW